MMDFPPGSGDPRPGSPPMEARWSPQMAEQSSNAAVGCCYRSISVGALIHMLCQEPKQHFLMACTSTSCQHREPATCACRRPTSDAFGLKWPRWPALPNARQCCFLPATLHFFTDTSTGFKLQPCLPAHPTELSPNGRLFIRLMVDIAPDSPYGDFQPHF